MTKTILSLLACISILPLSNATGLTLKVQNYTAKPIYLFLRPANGFTAVYSARIPPTPHNAHQVLTLEDAAYNIHENYDVMVGEKQGEPDWHALERTCQELPKEAAPHIRIDDGLKTTCTTSRHLELQGESAPKQTP